MFKGYVSFRGCKTKETTEELGSPKKTYHFAPITLKIGAWKTIVFLFGMASQGSVSG